MANLNPFLLAATTPSPDPQLLPLLRSKPELAATQDAHGYSLLHAASSYNHLDLLRTLVNEFTVDVNLKDEDGETCLFVAETVDMSKCLVEELHINTDIKNVEGLTALEKFEAEEEFPEVGAYLRKQIAGGGTSGATAALPPLPPNMRINVNTQAEQAAVDAQEPDPEFRRRIDELASKENFQTEEGQQELRELITDAVRNVSDDRDVRRRLM